MTRWLRAGIVGRPHGLDGSFHVLAPSPGLLVEGAVLQVGDQPRTVTRRAGSDTRVILRLKGCEDRAGAEALRGAELRVDRAQAPPLEPDEWWAEDLEGLAVVDGERYVGTVRRLQGLPSCEVLEVAREQGDLLVPLVADAVRAIDLERGAIDIDLRFLGEE